jgi:hypothetical protein
MKKKKLQALEDSLNNAINPKPKTDLSANVRNLLKDYSSEPISRPAKADNSLDSQTTQTRLSRVISLDSQTDSTRLSKPVKTGYPKDESLDSLIAKDKVWISKKEASLDILIAKEKSLDIQKRAKSEKAGKWEKYDKVRDRKGIFLRTDSDLTKQFKMFCIDNDLEFAQATEIAWVQFMESLDIQKSESLAIKISHDDRRLMIRWKSKGHIINLHLRYTAILNPKIRWNVRDDEKAARLNEVDSRVIELGIIQTQFQKNFKGKINSFSYYLNEIDNFTQLEMSGEVLDTMLEINRRRWQQMTQLVLDYNEFEMKKSES